MATPREPNLQAGAGGMDDFVNLPSGKPFGEREASDLLRAQGAPIIVLAGAAKSGKTTLLASLHDSFQKGPFAGYLSAGSETLIGFEERCFDSRVASGAENATTLHTRVQEGQLIYHMKLRNEDLKTPIKHLLLADMSGEYYGRALDSAAEMRGLRIIRRADHFVHLVDGGKLVSKEFGAYAQANAMMLMRRCFEEEMFEADAKVDILLTKWDIALARCGEEKALKALNSHQDAFSESFGQRIGRLRVTPIAARPHYKSPLPPGYGLTELLRCWVDEPPRKSEPRVRRLRLAGLSTAFDAFAIREAPEMFEGGSDA